MGSGFSVKAKANASAEIFIYEDVGESWFGGVTAKDFAKELKGLGKVEMIDLRINSYGGDVFDGLAIYRQLVDHPAKVVAHIDGIAASIASIIAMAGDEIEISESGFLMIHNAWGVAIGTADDMRTTADILEGTTSSLRDVYVARTGNDAAAVKDWMSAETWFTGQEAVDHGFASRVAANMKVAARAVDPSKHKFRNAPARLLGTPNLDDARARIAALRQRMKAA